MDTYNAQNEAVVQNRDSDAVVLIVDMVLLQNQNQCLIGQKVDEEDIL